LDLESARCECGARFVGEPLLESPSPRPALGTAFGAIGLAVLSILSLWKASLLALAPLAAFLGLRAIRATRRDPVRFGGRRTATVGLVLASLVGVGVSVRMLAGIPRVLREREESRAASTRAQMHHLAGELQRYRARYGAYPVRLNDLTKLEGEPGTPDSRDSWEQKISYVGYTGELATAGRPSAFNTEYELRSPGPDGIQNTADDVVMRTGIVVDSTDETAPLVAPSETKPVPLEESKPRKRAAARTPWSGLWGTWAGGDRSREDERSRGDGFVLARSRTLNPDTLC